MNLIINPPDNAWTTCAQTIVSNYYEKPQSWFVYIWNFWMFHPGGLPVPWRGLASQYTCSWRWGHFWRTITQRSAVETKGTGEITVCLPAPLSDIISNWIVVYTSVYWMHNPAFTGWPSSSSNTTQCLFIVQPKIMHFY